MAAALYSANCRAGSSYLITTTTGDAFLASGSPSNPQGSDLTSLNYGGAGTLAIAPASSPNGAFDSIIKFNTASAVSQFNTMYGAGNWQITGLQLSLASNFGTQGAHPNNNVFNNVNTGSFEVDWMGYDGWTEGTGSGSGTSGYPNNSQVSYNSISTLFSGGSDSLGTFTYTPPGNGVYANYNLGLDANMMADVMAGGDVSLYFYAADNQISYLFNSREFGSGHPELNITVDVVPEPGTVALLGVSLGGLMLARRRSKKQ